MIYRRKDRNKNVHRQHFYRVFTLCTVAVIILLHFFWEKSGSGVGFPAFQKAYAERVYNFSFSPSDTILIVAPHCDDEVLSSGGLIYDARSQGTKVYVIVVTNGDAFRVFWTRTKKAVKLGYRRQKESIAALQTLGVPRENIFFLGYPDQGLALLWTDHWSFANPYFSRFTRNWMDPYFTSYRPGSPYSGENLALELENIISQIQPTIIITASPFDRHPDHWATYAFTMYVLEKLRLRGAPSHEPRVYWYLVHYGVWPYAFGFRPKALLLPPPPLCLLQLDWQLYFPSSSANFAKMRAIRKYRSQSPVREHLLSFVRKNELFGQNPVIKIPSITVPIDIDGKVEEWPSSITRYVEPQRGEIWKRSPSFSSFMAARDSTNFYLALFLKKPISQKDVYTFFLYPVTALDESQGFVQNVHFSLQQKGSKTILSHSAITATTRGNAIEITIPLELLHHSPSLFFHAEIRRKKKIIGKTSWYLPHF